jgi:hypothetical protein
MKIRKTKTLLNNIKNYSRNHPLGHKIILHASFCGFAFILFSTAFQLTLEYHREIKAIEHQANFIQNSYSDSLARSLWDIDQAQIELQIKGIKSLPNISSVTLKKTKLAKNTSQKSKPLSKDSLKTHEFPLIHTRNDQPYTLGNLNIEFDLQVIYQRIWNKGFTILLNQTLLVALIILVIIIIFHRKIIRH